MNKKVNIIFLLLFSAVPFLFGQFNEYNYKRELKGITGAWHKIILPDEIFSRVSRDFSDIRIIGITPDEDTVEVPYILEVKEKNYTTGEIEFRLINESWDDGGYFFTYEISGVEIVDRIELEFGDRNFDWEVDLEGSNDQNDWFMILNDYRILSIKNELTDYNFTTLKFSDVKYSYIRMYIKTDRAPFLISSKINDEGTGSEILKKIKTKTVSVKNDDSTGETIIDINLPQVMPVAWIRININNGYDYYRPVTISYLSDSIKTQKGWSCNFSTVIKSTLSSFEKDGFSFPSTVTGKFQVIIANFDNEPLNIGEVEVMGNNVELTARFTRPAECWLVYGNDKSYKPVYDIEKFKDKIPIALTALYAGEEIRIEKETSIVEPLFKNKMWLWAVMFLVVLVIGFLTVKMINKK